MISRARAALAEEPPDVCDRVKLVEGGGEDAPRLADVLEAERLAGERDPYRGVARLLHLVGRRA